MTTLLERIEIESAPNPTAAIIWMHGLGASGDDFAAIVPELDLTGSPAIRFVFPHAPVMPVTINGGYVMPAWYDIFGTELGPGAVRQEDTAGIAQSQRHIEALIANEVARDIHPSPTMAVTSCQLGTIFLAQNLAQALSGMKTLQA